ncbi:hypothetical protein KR018_000865 [Drosophila ironensis]|nr:hypothetical protein KR018_000865 [Drosophila ironensis]
MQAPDNAAARDGARTDRSANEGQGVARYPGLQDHNYALLLTNSDEEYHLGLQIQGNDDDDTGADENANANANGSANNILAGEIGNGRGLGHSRRNVVGNQVEGDGGGPTVNESAGENVPVPVNAGCGFMIRGRDNATETPARAEGSQNSVDENQSVGVAEGIGNGLGEGNENIPIPSFALPSFSGTLPLRSSFRMDVLAEIDPLGVGHTWIDLHHPAPSMETLERMRYSRRPWGIRGSSQDDGSSSARSRRGKPPKKRLGLRI